MSKSQKAIGKRLESEIEDHFLTLTGQTRHDDVRFRTHRIANSGSMDSDKGDIITIIPFLVKQLLIECKRRASNTKKDGPIIDIPFLWLTKIEEEATNRRCLPIVTFGYKGPREKRLQTICRCKDIKELFNIDVTAILREESLYIRESKKVPTFRLIHKNLLELKDKIYRLEIDPKYGDWCLIDFLDFIELLKKLKQESSVDMPRGKTIAVDVDGCLAQYDHWRGYKHIGEPIKETVDFLKAFKEKDSKNNIIIHTSRITDKVTNEIIPEAISILEDWLKKNNIPYDSIWTHRGKPVASMYLDDRAVNSRDDLSRCLNIL